MRHPGKELSAALWIHHLCASLLAHWWIIMPALLLSCYLSLTRIVMISMRHYGSSDIRRNMLYSRMLQILKQKLRRGRWWKNTEQILKIVLLWCIKFRPHHGNFMWIWMYSCHELQPSKVEFQRELWGSSVWKEIFVCFSFLVEIVTNFSIKMSSKPILM